MAENNEIKMWVDVQRDGHPAEYWCCFCWMLLSRWATSVQWRRQDAKPTELCLGGCPKLANRSQPLMGGSSPYCDNMWRRHCCFVSDWQYTP